MENCRKQLGPIDEFLKLSPHAASQRLISGKWNMLILYYLDVHVTLRFNELLRLMPQVTQATLTKQLRVLEEQGLVNRKVYPEVPPRVEYSLTEIGLKFHPVLEAYEDFGHSYLEFLRSENEK